MVNQGANIFDLLLGVQPTPKAADPGISSQTENSGFAEIFDLLLGDGIEKQGRSGEATPFDLVGLRHEKASSGSAATAGQGFALMQRIPGDGPQSDGSQLLAISPDNETTNEILAGNHSGVRKAAFDLMADGDAAEPPIDMDRLLTVAESVLKGKTSLETTTAIDPAKLLPTGMQSATPQLRDALMMEPAEVEAGAYRIKSFAVHGDQLVLDIESTEDPSRQVRLSLPAERIRELAAGADEASVTRGSTASRVAVDTPSTVQTRQLEALFSRLNLKEIEIADSAAKSDPAATGPVADDGLEVTIVAERSGQEILLRSRLNKSDMRAVKQSRLTLGDQPQAEMPTAENSLRTESPHVKTLAELLTAHQGGRPVTNQNTVTTSGGGGQGQFGGETFAAGLESSLTTEGSSSETGHTARSTEQQSIRFQLPDQFASALKPGSQSVTLRIDPEHLGTARLHLSLRQEMLTARVTVETPQAKAAVESSLDQLTDQLARAGVKVDQIQVNVAGSDVNEQLFQRRPEWNRAARRNIAPLVGDTDQDNIAGVPRPAYVPPTYVGAEGVNLYA